MKEDYILQVGREGERGIGILVWRNSLVLMIIGLLVTALATFVLLPAVGVEEEASAEPGADAPAAASTGDMPSARIVTEKGDIVVQLRPDAAPQHVENFIELSQSGFYDGLAFHRVEPGFVIQGGDPSGDGTGGPGYTIPAEIELPHREGALAAARRADSVNPERESSGSQFYITLAPQPALDGQYTVYGYVTEGMDVVQNVEVGDTIETIEIQQ